MRLTKEKLEAKDYNKALDIWERSVLATHDFLAFNCQIKCNTLSLKSSAGVFQSNRLRGRVFNL